MSTMKVVEVAMESLSPDPANLRKHGVRNIEAIKASLRKFGQQKPIIVDSNGIILAGNGTYEAAKALGWVKIRIVRTNLKGADATGFSIADNRTAELAEWDDQALAETLRSLQSEEFEIESTGFTDEDVSAILQKLGTDMIEDGAAPEEFDSYGDDIETEYCCPKCNYKWSGKPA